VWCLPTSSDNIGCFPATMWSCKEQHTWAHYCRLEESNDIGCRFIGVSFVLKNTNISELSCLTLTIRYFLRSSSYSRVGLVVNFAKLAVRLWLFVVSLLQVYCFMVQYTTVFYVHITTTIRLHSKVVCNLCKTGRYFVMVYGIVPHLWPTYLHTSTMAQYHTYCR
jgi:hypothetical protein